MALLRRADLLLIATLALSSGAHAQSGRTIFCCEDDTGRPACGDTLPPICFGKAYREMTPQGTVKRYVAAPLSAEELAQRRAEERRRRAEEARALQQRRLDEALLETYASLADLDARRERSLADAGRSMEEQRRRLEELEAHRQKLTEEQAFYRDGETPAELANELRVIEAEMAAQRVVLEAKKRELETTRNRFDEDRRRYLELTGNAQPQR
jgi:hypothetical protein